MAVHIRLATPADEPFLWEMPRNPALRLYERLGFAYVASDEGGSWTMLRLNAK